MPEMDFRDGITFRPATMDDAERLFEWRNDPETRKQSVHTEEVLWDTHLEWLRNSLANPNRKIMIAEINGEPVGTVRLDVEEPRSELSWTVAPLSRGKGVGGRMIKKATELFSQPLRAKIKPGNLSSIKIAEKSGFRRQSENRQTAEWFYYR